jgi:hypothetical protein
MQRNVFIWARFMRVNIAKLAIAVVAVSALLITMAVSAPSNVDVASPAAVQTAPSTAHSTAQTTHLKTKTTTKAIAKISVSTVRSRSSVHVRVSDSNASTDPDFNAAARLAFGAGGVGTRPPGSIEAPPYIVSDCSVNVSAALQTWLQGLAPGTVWYSPVGSCYLIDNGITLTFPRGITIDGGVFTERSLGWLGRRAFFVIGGADMTFEHLTIQGPDMTNVWDPARAFQSGIELDGTTNAVIANVRINNVFGDGITLSPLRGSADHSSGVIIKPVTNLTMTNVWIDGAGRQGISPVSVQNATMTNITLHNIDMNAFDFETDGQGNEGGENVRINGCNVDGANSMANISENAGFTGPITFENCNMTMDAGTAVYVRSTSNSIENGRILFQNDTLRCPTTAPVACIQLMNGQNVEFADSTIAFGTGEPRPTENVYSAIDKTNATFYNDVVTGYGGIGSFDKTSSVSVSGGSWTRG